MAERLRIFFATDVHGSEKCFRKFLNAASAYKADALILGGDIAGKAVQAIVHQPDGTYRCVFRGHEYVVEPGEALAELERLLSDNGYYPYRAEPGEFERRVADGSVEELLEELMQQRVSHWLDLAADRLGAQGTPAFWMLGNDDPPQLGSILDQAGWGTHAEDKVLDLGGHELLSFGWSNPTPWNSFREMPESELGQRLHALAVQLRTPGSAIFNLHVPPYGTGLDEAPVIDSDYRVQASTGQVRMAAVGSTAVRQLILDYQPLVSLHGHVHESSGFRRLGRTVAFNPGSDYGTGSLNGVLINLEPTKLKSYQFVRG